MNDGSVPAVGELWKRKDGRLVKIAAERSKQGAREVELAPYGSSKGRSVWKRDIAVAAQLTKV